MTSLGLLFCVILTLVTVAKATEQPECNVDLSSFICPGNITLENCTCKCCIGTNCRNCSYGKTTAMTTAVPKVTDSKIFCKSVCERICGPNPSFCNSTCRYTSDNYEECVSYNVNCGLNWNPNRFCEKKSGGKGKYEIMANSFYSKIGFILFTVMVLKNI